MCSSRILFVSLLASAFCAASILAQGPPLRAELVLGQDAYFDGEPIYILARIRNISNASVPVAPLRTGCAETTVLDSAGRDMTRERVWVDTFGTPPPLQLAPDSAIYWVIPIHWFWGSGGEPTSVGPFYSFRPGSYQVLLTFTGCPDYGSSPLSRLQAIAPIRITPRSSSQSAARSRILGAVDSLVTLVKTAGSWDTILPRLRELLADTALASYKPYIALDVAQVVQAFGRYSRSYVAALDSIRIAYLLTLVDPTPVALRLVEALDPMALARTDFSRIAPALRPYVARREREPSYR